MTPISLFQFIVAAGAGLFTIFLLGLIALVLYWLVNGYFTPDRNS